MSFCLLDFRVLDSQEILITWEDDHRSLFDPRTLRLFCPCAQCVDEWSGKRTIQAEKIPASLSLKLWNPVGRYAVKISWSDGHQTGIYSFDYLRQLCSCHFCHDKKNKNLPPKREKDS